LILEGFLSEPKLIGSISSVYNLYFSGHMESRKVYNHPSVCLLRHARFQI